MSPARVLATWFGCGLSPVAPGTVGTLGTLPLAVVLLRLPPMQYWAATVAITVLGIWASGRVARELATDDPQSVVIDEVSGTLIALGFVQGLGVVAGGAAVLLFRIFDIWKPGPIDWVQRLHGGFGIMLDDVLAGLGAGVLARLGVSLLG